MSTEYKSGAKRRFDSPITMPDGINVETLSGALTLNQKSADWQILDPGGSSRVVTLPPEEVSEGRVMHFYNAADAAENITIQNDAAGSLGVINPGGSAAVVCKATTWSVAGALSQASLPVTGFKQAVVTGGAAGDLTLTGVAAGDSLIGVIQHVGAGTDVTDVADLTSEFSITGANTINNTGGTNTTGSKLVVTWYDLA